jgi:hypothetical protein
MGDSALIEIALGLILVFVLFSVLVSAANELIVGFFKSRSASLWDGVLTLFNNEANLRAQFFNHPLIKSLEPPKSIGFVLNNQRRNIPSYIEPRTFAIVLLHLLQNPRAVLEGVERELTQTLAALRAGDASGLAEADARLRTLGSQVDQTSSAGQALLNDIQDVRVALRTAATVTPTLVTVVEGVLSRLPTHQRAALNAGIKAVAPGLADTLNTLIDNAAGSIEGLRDEIERWFRQGMDGVSGWYKRWTQAVQFALAVCLAAVINLDVVRIATALQANAQLRHSTAAQAMAFARTESLDDRNVVAKASTGAFQVTLDPEGPQAFSVHAQFPKPPQNAANITATLDSPPPNVTLKCTAFTVDDVKATSTCSIGGVDKRTDAVIRIAYQGQDAQPLTATLPIVIPPDSEAYYKGALAELNATTLPFGWEGNSVQRFYERPLWVVFGWLLAALAASFGAPFWFDLLKRVANLRGSEPNPDERKSKS